MEGKSKMLLHTGEIEGSGMVVPCVPTHCTSSVEHKQTKFK